jgi:hypothetical protein
MVATTAWIVKSAYASAGMTASSFNSLASGSVVVGTTAIANAANLYLYGDVSFSLVVGGTTLATSYLSLYILPLNQDGTTYGDGTTTGSTAPTSGYLVGSVGVKSGVTSGSAITGTFRGIVQPPTNFYYAIVNNLGIALNASAAATVSVLQYSENENQ